jgi:aminopeptidase-like protein
MQKIKLKSNIGLEMHKWASDLFPINRSITGSGVRETLKYLVRLLPDLNVCSVPSGTKAFDWVVPNEWSIKEAYLEDENGERVVDFKENNLHVVGYSEPVNKWLSLEDLQSHLYSLSDNQEAIPYVTSYYKRRWGFCLTHKQRMRLKRGQYHAVIDSKLESGVLNYGELVLPGRTDKEILLSTYICHPSMANNELSGPVVTTALSQYLSSLKDREYTYRVIFIPETIGSIVYLSKHLDHLKNNVIAGFNITCIGDDKSYSYLPSRDGNTLSDKVAKHVLKHIDPNFKCYTYLDRGSDERQYCSPGVDLPIASIMRTKYGGYKEYHTSLDNLDLVTPSGLNGGLQVLIRAIDIIENNIVVKNTLLCEPHFSKYNLRNTLSGGDLSLREKVISDLIAYSDGTRTLLEISEIIDQPFWSVLPISKELIDCNILEELVFDL